MKSTRFLEPTKYHILLALAAEPMPGAAIREQIIGDTLGVYLRDSTLYDAFKSLVTLKLITADPRKHYHLTDTGRRALELRSRTMQWSVRLSQDRLHWR